MSILKKILSKLGFGEDRKDTDVPGAARQDSSTQAAPAPTSPAAPTVRPISEVDVVTKLESLAAAHTQKLNWKQSIVDLLKLLDIDSSLEARRELATELGYPGDKMGDSAKMNIWLHKAVLKELAENGGNVPADLLD